MAEQETEFADMIAAHAPQLRNSGVHPIFWTTLFRKLRDEVWDLASTVVLNRVIAVDPETEKETNPSSPRVYLAENALPLHPDRPEHIYLIDHAWTFDLTSARNMLVAYPSLLNRMCDIVDVPANAAESSDELVDDVLRLMWKYINTYSFNSASLDVEQKLPKWYMMDEIGSRLRHSDSPNCRIVPFYFIPQDITYSLLFPIKIIPPGEELTRNFVENIRFPDPLTRQCRLLPWVDFALPSVGFSPRDVAADYFSSSKLLDTLPVPLALSGPKLLEEKGHLNVYAEYEVLADSLTDSRFRIVKEQADADILWYNRHFNDFRGLSMEFPDKFVNQFPYESVVTVKDLLAIVCRRASEGKRLVNPDTLQVSPQWLPATYNLDTDLPNFVAYFRAREERGLDNFWICKPWNLARSLDITISDELDCIVRLPETGPKLCCKYIENPVLFQRDDIPEGPVKFDLRFIAIVKSVSPLSVAVYKRFWLRFANKPFALDEFEVYDKHFTVMNYGQGVIHQMFCDRFIEKFEKQHPEQSWNCVEKDLYGVVREVFKAAASRDPPEGFGHSVQSRAVYGLDFMLAWKEDNGRKSVQPMLLEINYSPDCKRACDYYPGFYNEIFSYMFLDEVQDTIAEL
ncbi:tubulin--tyrosine ligase-like protein 12 [Paramacrobiotus metropolitanus]|uniref:tubulin--tyrosine ligase-like protein 12 n=1 Tax=Paramacrobiotus metropolitanus TaxID=2943436 RepID=UPI002445DA66|nr:tubulin--tyrosine ligase-like protein 12 [Paramacrobiotus metropolitanus]